MPYALSAQLRNLLIEVLGNFWIELSIDQHKQHAADLS